MFTLIRYENANENIPKKICDSFRTKHRVINTEYEQRVQIN